MAIPNQNELIFYTNKALTDQDWRTNWLKIIEWLTDGTYDFSIGGLTVTSLTSTGALTITGTVTATAFVGDGSGLTNLVQTGKNFLYNPLGQVDTAGADYTLVKDTYGSRADNWDGMATGTAVSAGVLTITEAANTGRTGWAMKFAGVTLTGSGVLNLRQRLYSEDASKLKNQSISFQAYTYHDIGVAKNYKIFYRKADVKDNFSAVTEIANSGNISVPDTTSTQITDENVSLGDCSNGLEIEIEITTGAIPTKNVELTEMQLEISTTATNFEYRLYEQEAFMNKASVPFTGVGQTIRQAGTDRAWYLKQEGVSASSKPAVEIYSNAEQTNVELVKIHQDNATGNQSALTITHDNTSDATASARGLFITGKWNTEFNQTISGGSSLHVRRTINEAGSHPTAKISAEGASDTQDVLEIANEGSGSPIKFTGTTKVVRYYSMGAGDFVPQTDTSVWNNASDGTLIRSNSVSVLSRLVGGVHLPNGATVTSLKVWWSNTHASAVGTCNMYVSANYGSPVVTMATADSTPNGGQHTAEDTIIASATVENTVNKISVVLEIDPFDNNQQVLFYMAVITYEIDEPLP